MNLANEQENASRYRRLWERARREPRHYIVYSCILAAMAVYLGGLPNSEFAYVPPAASWKKWMAIGFAFLGCICPTILFWCEYTGSAKLRIPKWFLGFAGVVLALSTTVVVAHLFSDWAKSGYLMSILPAYCISRVAKRELDKNNRAIVAARLPTEQYRNFLSIAAAELFDAVTDAHELETKVRNTSAKDGDISTNGRTEC